MSISVREQRQYTCISWKMTKSLTLGRTNGSQMRGQNKNNNAKALPKDIAPKEPFVVVMLV
jgi:hypothetical protein